MNRRLWNSQQAFDVDDFNSGSNEASIRCIHIYYLLCCEENDFIMKTFQDTNASSAHSFDSTKLRRNFLKTIWSINSVVCFNSREMIEPKF